jgi:ketosteroid isomerase-like protein
MKRVCLVILVLLGLLSAAASQQPKMSPALASLIAAERAFARTSVEKGIRESFLAFFADDGINFQPHPVKSREAILKRPAPATRPPIVLNWEPAYADISNAGDLGYTTGPYVLTDNSPQKNPPHYGFYFSIWKRQADGSWKVALDLGIDTPDHSKQKFPLQAAPRVPPAKSAANNVRADAESLMKLDRDFLAQATAGELARAYLDYLDEHARLHRDGSFPFTDRRAIRSFLMSKSAQMTWDPIAADVARSNDLGYTYGSYELKASDSPPEKGYYVRVWKRNRNGEWKVALDTLHPVPG